MTGGYPAPQVVLLHCCRAHPKQQQHEIVVRRARDGGIFRDRGGDHAIPGRVREATSQRCPVPLRNLI
jgi:hypothetical protein